MGNEAGAPLWAGARSPPPGGRDRLEAQVACGRRWRRCVEYDHALRPAALRGARSLGRQSKPPFVAAAGSATRGGSRRNVHAARQPVLSPLASCGAVRARAGATEPSGGARVRVAGEQGLAWHRLTARVPNRQWTPRSRPIFVNGNPSARIRRPLGCLRGFAVCASGRGSRRSPSSAGAAGSIRDIRGSVGGPSS